MRWAVAASALAHAALLARLIGGSVAPALELPAQPVVVLIVEPVAPSIVSSSAGLVSPEPPALSPLPAAEPLLPAPRPLAKPAVAPAAVAATEALAAIKPAAGSEAPPASAGAGMAAEPLREAAPLAAGNPPPVYPLAARRQGVEGRVILDVAVDADGRATDVAIARSSGHRLLDAAALRAVRDWRFSPARRDDRPVAARVQVPVTFRLAAAG